MRARKTPLGSAASLLLAGTLALLSPGLEPWRLAAQTLNAGAPAGMPLPGGWAAVSQRFSGAGNSLPQSQSLNGFGPGSLVSGLGPLDLTTERGRKAAEPLVSRLASLGVTPESFEVLAPGDQRRLLETAVDAAAADQRVEAGAAAALAEVGDSRSLKEAASRFEALGRRLAVLRGSEVADKVARVARAWGAPASDADRASPRVPAAAPRRTDLPPAGDGRLSALQVQALHVELVDPERTGLSEQAFKAFVEGDPAQRRVYTESLAKGQRGLLQEILGGMYLAMTRVLDAGHLGPERMPLAVGLGRRFLEFLEQVRQDRSVPAKVRALAGVSGTLLRNEALVEELSRQKQVYGRLRALEQAALALIKAPAGRSAPAPVSEAWILPQPIAPASKASPSEGPKRIVVSLERIGRQAMERAFALERLRARYVKTRAGSRFSESAALRTMAELKSFLGELLSWLPFAYADVTRFQDMTLHNQFLDPLRYAGRAKRILRVPRSRDLRMTPEGVGFVIRARFETDVREPAVLDAVKHSIEEYWQGSFSWAGRPLRLRTEVSFKVLAPGEAFAEGALFLRDEKEGATHAPPDGIALGHDFGHDTPAHEFGHVLGLPDEYQESYDVRRKAAIHVQFPGSLMGASRTGSVLERHLKTAFFLLRRHSLDPSPPAPASK